MEFKGKIVQKEEKLSVIPLPFYNYYEDFDTFSFTFSLIFVVYS